MANELSPVEKPGNIFAISGISLKSMPTAYIGLGANLHGPAGPPRVTVARSVERLSQLGRVVGRSGLYSTAPVGFAEQPRFLNAVAALETGLSPRALLERLLEIEREFGRDRSAGVANGPRALDLDILLYGDQIVSEPGLEIPHPRLKERAFALVPLAEIAPEADVPPEGFTVSEWLRRLRTNDPIVCDDVVKAEAKGGS